MYVIFKEIKNENVSIVLETKNYIVLESKQWKQRGEKIKKYIH